MPEDVVTQRVFTEETIKVDGRTGYSECVFDRCVMVFDGSGFRFDRCSFRNCEWSIEGPATTTLNFLAGLWPDKGQDGVFEQVFQHITGDKKVANGLMGVRKRAL